MKQKHQWRTYSAVVLAVAVSVLLGACSDTNQTQKIEQHIDSASEALKQQVRALHIEQEVADVKRDVKQFATDVAINDQTRKIGANIRDGLREVSDNLDKWMSPRQTSSRSTTPEHQ